MAVLFLGAVFMAVTLLGRGIGALVAAGIVAVTAGGIGHATLRSTACRWLHWDTAGFVCTFSTSLLLYPALWSAFRIEDVPLDHAAAAALFAGTGGLATGAWLAFLLRRREKPVARELWSRLFRVWSEPSADWGLLVFGFIATIPLLGLHSTIVSDTDSMRMISSITRVRSEGLRPLVETQEVLLPHLLLGPSLALGGIIGAVGMSILTLQALGGVASYVTWRMTRSAAASLAAVLALLSFRPVVSQANQLPMYAAMLSSGLLALWLGYRAIETRGRKRWLLAAACGGLLVVAAEAHGVGQILLAAPLLLMIFVRSWRSLGTVAGIYLALALAYVPRAVINVAEGGFEHFRSTRVEWMVQQGYLSLINAEFWQYPTETATGYLESLGRSLARGIDWPGFVAVAVLVASIALWRWRGRLFALGLAALLIFGLLAVRPPPFPRYLTPLMVGVAVGVGVGIALMRARGPYLRVGSHVAVAVLLVSAVATLVAVGQTNEEAKRRILAKPLGQIASHITDDRGVLGVRSHRLNAVDPDVRAASSSLDEEEFVTFLTWPSDEQVIRIMREHDIGWILLIPEQELQVDYHETWLVPTYGKRVRFVDEVPRSRHFCQVLERQDYRLFRLGTCPDAG